MRKIFIICSVRDVTPEYRAKLEAYADMLEENGADVHLPHRDTDQEQGGFDICRQNAMAINLSNEVHVFYSDKSQGTHFDMGVAFALNQISGKDIKIVPIDSPIDTKPGKSFARLLDEWMANQIDENVSKDYHGMLRCLNLTSDEDECYYESFI